MRIAFSKPTSSEQELERLLTSFRDERYEGLQLKNGQFAPYVARADDYLRAWGGDPGRASALIVFDTLDDAGEERLLATMDFAARVGTELVVFCHNHGHDGVDDPQRREWAGRLSTIGASARERGVALSLHHHTDQPVMLHDDFSVFFDAVEPGTVGLTVDTAHLAKSGFTDIPGFIREFGHLIDNVHLKDYADQEWRLLGEGELDLEGILRALADVGFDGWLCVDEESTADLDTGLRRSRAWLDDHLGDATAPPTARAESDQ